MEAGRSELLRLTEPVAPCYPRIGPSRVLSTFQGPGFLFERGDLSRRNLAGINLRGPPTCVTPTYLARWENEDHIDHTDTHLTQSHMRRVRLSCRVPCIVWDLAPPRCQDQEALLTF